MLDTPGSRACASVPSMGFAFLRGAFERSALHIGRVASLRGAIYGEMTPHAVLGDQCPGWIGRRPLPYRISKLTMGCLSDRARRS